MPTQLTNQCISWQTGKTLFPKILMNKLKVRGRRFQETAIFTMAIMTGPSSFGAPRVRLIVGTKTRITSFLETTATSLWHCKPSSHVAAFYIFLTFLYSQSPLFELCTKQSTLGGSAKARSIQRAVPRAI